MAVHLNWGDTIGWAIPNRGDNDATSKMKSLHNVFCITGYFPLIGIITGLARAIFAIVGWCKQPAQGGYWASQIARGCIEMIPSAGIWLMLTDLAALITKTCIAAGRTL